MNLRGHNKLLCILDDTGFFVEKESMNTISTTNSSGWTGMFGSTPGCAICKKAPSNYIDCNINFDNKITSSNDVYTVCLSCSRETKKLLKKVKKMKVAQLPLHINDKNIFVREAVKNRLAGKWLCNL